MYYDFYFNIYLFNFSVGCAPGTYLATDKCVDCAKGFYAEEEYSSSCTACPPDMSTAETGSSSLADCIGMIYMLLTCTLKEKYLSIQM